MCQVSNLRTDMEDKHYQISSIFSLRNNSLRTHTHTYLFGSNRRPYVVNMNCFIKLSGGIVDGGNVMFGMSGGSDSTRPNSSRFPHTFSVIAASRCWKSFLFNLSDLPMRFPISSADHFEVWKTKKSRSDASWSRAST